MTNDRETGNYNTISELEWFSLSSDPFAQQVNQQVGQAYHNFPDTAEYSEIQPMSQVKEKRCARIQWTEKGVTICSQTTFVGQSVRGYLKERSFRFGKIYAKDGELLPRDFKFELYGVYWLPVESLYEHQIPVWVGEICRKKMPIVYQLLTSFIMFCLGRTLWGNHGSLQKICRS